MNNPTGRVVSLVDDRGGARAVVEVDGAPACPRCAAGKGCGAGLLPTGGPRRFEADIREGFDARVDDRVEVTLAPRNLLRAAVIVYGVPLAGGLGGAAAAYAFALGDAGAALAALFGLAAGLAASRWRLGQAACLRDFTPMIERLC